MSIGSIREHRIDTVNSASDGVVEDTDRLDVLAARVRLGAMGIWFCGILLAIYTLYIGRNLFVPIAVAIFAYLTLRPVTACCSKIGIPSAVSAAIVMLVLGLLIGGGGYLLSGPAQEMVAEAPEAMNVAKKKLRFVFDRIESVNQATEEISTAAEVSESPEEKPVPVEIKQPAWSTNDTIVSGTGNMVSFFSIAAVLLYFLMASGDSLLRNIIRALPTFSSKRRFVEAVDNVQDALSSYLAQVTAINAGLGVAVGVAMWLLGVPSPLLWGVIAMVLNSIPIVGALCGVAMVFFVSLVTFEQGSYAFVVAGTYLALTSIEGQFITPSIIGRSMKMNSVLVFLSIVVWGWLWGVMGVFLAVPFLIAMMMASEKCEAMSGIAKLLSGREGCST